MRRSEIDGKAAGDLGSGGMGINKTGNELPVCIMSR